MKTIGILTSGGDAQGMNAVINQAVAAGEKKGIKIRAYYRGYQGLIDNDYIDLTSEITKPYHHQGGTFLGTSRSQDFLKDEVRRATVARLKEEGVTALIVIGGDGSYRGALELIKIGFPTIAIPGTIDNDIPLTELTLGFQTAIQNVVETVDIISTSAASHGHIFGIEVMGRKAGDIALWTGMALDADYTIASPEDYQINQIAAAITDSQASGKKFQLIIIAEGVTSAQQFKADMESETPYSIHDLILGHIQRGGNAVLGDRILGKLFAEKAIDYLNNENNQGACLAVQNHQVVVEDIKKVLNGTKKLIKPYQ